MSIARRIAELERERAELRSVIDLSAARLSAVDHELKVLRQSTSSAADYADMSLTDAIVAVLRNDGGLLSPTEIRIKLETGGRTEARNKVSATLDYLRKRERVILQEPGKYLAK